MVGGGSNNTVRGSDAAIGGGFFNSVQGDFGAVGGGAYNFALGTAATVGGGGRNCAFGSYATVSGGFLNDAGGDYSFAAGRHAQANHAGSFVWGDSQPDFKPSSATDEFNVYASGGVRIFTNSTATAGVVLAPGGGSWSSVSDRDAKENLESIDEREVIERVCALPISTWNYKTQDDSVRHMGPMAQDFHGAFGLGISDELIDTIDPDGVALAAIQGLRLVVADKEAEIETLKANNDELEHRVARLESIVAEVATK